MVDRDRTAGKKGNGLQMMGFVGIFDAERKLNVVSAQLLVVSAQLLKRQRQ